MPVKNPRRREFPELMTDHFLGDENRNELVAVVDLKRQAHELRQNRRAAAPRLYRHVAAAGASCLRLLQEIPVNERAFPQRACQGTDLLSFLVVTAAQDEFLRRLVGSRLLALGRLAPRRCPMFAAVGATAIRMIDGIAGNTTGNRTCTPPARPPGLADDLVDVVGIRDRTDRRPAFGAHHARLA